MECVYISNDSNNNNIYVSIYLRGLMSNNFSHRYYLILVNEYDIY